MADSKTRLPRDASLLTAHYMSLEKRLRVSEDPTFGPLVVPNGNSSAPIHRWFHLKESFSTALLSTVLSRLNLATETDLSLIDPYAGVGTSLVSALSVEDGAKQPAFTRVHGIERNPFLQLVAATKVRSIVEPPRDVASFRDAVVKLYYAKRTKPAPPPALSTFGNPDYFPRAPLQELLRLKTAVEVAEGDEHARDIARVCLAGCVEPVSNLRRDGRALRHEERTARIEPVEEFERRMSMASADLNAVTRVEAAARVVLGDGRAPSKHVSNGARFRLALFSPPYPNNIDYTEVYKLENWFLDLIGSEAEFRAQRLRTLRSHPSVAFEESYELSENGYKGDVAQTLAPLLEAIPADRYRHQRRRLVRGYFEDMLQTFEDLYELVEVGGNVVYVVGNSTHGHGDTSFVVATDVVMAALASLVGFTTQELIVDRFPARRNIPSSNAPSAFIRESVVILKK